MVVRNASSSPSTASLKTHAFDGHATRLAFNKFRDHPQHLWRGYTALVARNLPFTAMQFPMFEFLRVQMYRYREEQGNRSGTLLETGLVTAFSAGSAGSVAAVITTPIDVVKTRIMLGAAGGGDEGQRQKAIKELQAQGKDAKTEIEKAQQAARGGRAGTLAVGKEVLRTEGLKGLFRGGALRGAWTALGSGLYLGVYESGRRAIFDKTVTIKVGPEAKEFIVHRALLCHHSSYFKAALADHWKEGQQGLIELKDGNPEIFGRFCLWLYWGKIMEDHEAVTDIPWDTLTACYLLAEMRDVPMMQNAVIDLLIRKTQATNLLPTREQRHVWEQTTENSPLRKMIVDITVLRGDIAQTLKDENEENMYDKSFLVDAFILKYQHPNLISHEDFFTRRCLYHIHKEGEPRCTT
ncbi:MAG: hypothetical protein Q9222_005392 [Ikaeria aurantiellina]